jgi:hypothetical protein
MSEPEQAPRPLRTFERLASMRVALGLIGAIVVACIVATVVPQGPDVAEQLQRNPEAGRWLKRLAAAGLTTIFSAWWFIGLLAALGASLAVCVARRLRALLTVGTGTTGRLLTLGTLLVHTGMLLILVGGAIKLFWSERGTLALREGGQAAGFTTDDQRHRPLPCTLQLVRFEIERYPAVQAPAATVQSETLAIRWPGAPDDEELPVAVGVERLVTPKVAGAASNQSYRVTVLRRIPDFAMDTATRTIQSRSDKLLNPAVLVRVAAGSAPAVERWLFARYPDFDMTAMSGHAHPAEAPPLKMQYKVMVTAPELPPRIKAFKSTLRILKDAQVVREQTIEVNAPLSYGGYSFFQSGYNEDDLSWTALLVVRDPSVPVVYFGFILLGIGAFLTACWRAEQVGEESKC